MPASSPPPPNCAIWARIGGNLLQQTRCWYYRGPYYCWLKGGDTCFARDGENEYHSIFGIEQSPCVSAHPSDPAAALLALGARSKVAHASGESEMPIEELYALPEDTRRTFVTLPEGALITEIVLPPGPPNRKSTYVKGMARATWAFALAGVAISLQLDGNSISEARVALAGVAPIPIRAQNVEAQLSGASLAGLDVESLANLLVADARPLAHNGYKVDMLRGLFVEAIEKLTS